MRCLKRLCACRLREAGGGAAAARTQPTRIGLHEHVARGSHKTDGCLAVHGTRGGVVEGNGVSPVQVPVVTLAVA